jgi:hypothetical protein
MSLDISYYRKINNGYKVSGTVSKKESDIYALKLHMANTFSDSLDYHDETLRNTVNQRFVISYYRDENKRKIIAFPDEILNMGDMIDCFGSKWLTTYINPDQQVYTKGIIQQCNYILPFQTTSSTIYNEPCIMIAQSEYKSGEDQGNVITLAENQRVVLIQYNENTKYLVEEKRIFIDQLCDKPKVYKITKVDRISYMNGTNGLLKLTCDVGEVTNADREDLKIADYISTTPIPTPVPTELGLSYITNTKVPPIIYDATNSPKQIKVGGSPVPFDCLFKNLQGEIQNLVLPKWGLIVDDSIKDKVTLTYNASYPNRAYVQVLAGNENIGKQFTLELVDTNNLYGKCDLAISVVSYT